MVSSPHDLPEPAPSGWFPASDDRLYLRPLLKGGGRRFDDVEIWARGTDGCIVRRRMPVTAFRLWCRHLPSAQRRRLREQLENLNDPPRIFAGIALDKPAIMGIVNVTPDSFSDGGKHLRPGDAVAHGRALHEAGAAILDIGGESTRPGAATVAEDEERRRILPVIQGLRDCGAVLSADTRKPGVMRAAVKAGAAIINDVTALEYASDSLQTAAMSDAAVVLMHAQGTPQDMQDNPVYDHPLLDVFDYLEDRVQACIGAGIAKERIAIDPGIGFGKNLAHNMALMRGLSMFRALGLPLLLGVSRKSMIGALGDEPVAPRRMPGSLAAAIWGVENGADILRVHDVRETAQALAVWRALAASGSRDEI